MLLLNLQIHYNIAFQTRLPYLLSIVGIIICAVLGGLGPGLVCLMTSIGIVAYLVLEPIGDLTHTLGANLPSIVLYLIVSLFIILIGSTLRSAMIESIDLVEKHRAAAEVETQLIDALSDGTIVLEEDLTVISCDPHVCDLLGLEGEFPLPLLSGRNSSIIEQMRSVTEDRKPIDIFDDNSKRWFEATLVRAGSRLIFVFKDVTARRSIESELRALVEANEQDLLVFEAILRDSPIGFALLDRELRFALVNDRLAALNGFPVEAHIGKRIDELLGPPYASFLVDVMTSVMDEGEPVHNVEIVADPRPEHVNSFAWLASWHPVRDRDGSIIGVGATVVDVSERIQDQARLARSEARLRLLLDAISVVTWAGSSSGDFVKGQESWAAYTGQALDEMGGDGWLQAIHPSDRTKAEAEWRSATREKTIFSTLVRLWCQEACAYHYCFIEGVPVRSNDAVIEWVGTVRDVHEERRLLEERDQLLASERAARSEAERESRLKDEFVATLSHELRTPLTAIQGWTDVIRQRPEDMAVLQDGLMAIGSAVTRQTKMIEDLLDLSRIAVGRLRLERTLVDLGDVATEVVHQFGSEATRKRLTLTCEMPEHPVIVWGDPDRLEQVVSNLLSNAIKFTSDGGEVNVSVSTTEGEAILLVRDNGEGIDPKFLPFVFDRFRQATGDSSRRHAGLGLGLAIVKELVTMHSGHIEPRSLGSGHGATFEVRLPLSRVAHHPKNVPMPPISVPTKSLEGVRILLVDDDSATLSVLAILLTAESADVTRADSAAAGLKQLLEHRQDILLSDIGMPEEDGFRFIRRIRSLEDPDIAQIPAVAITAFARPEDRRMADEAGFNGFVTKPVQIGELVNEIHRVLRRSPSSTDTAVPHLE